MNILTINYFFSMILSIILIILISSIILIGLFFLFLWIIDEVDIITIKNKDDKK